MTDDREAAIEAACNAANKKTPLRVRDELGVGEVCQMVIAALDAYEARIRDYEAHRREREPVKVKQLEWKPYRPNIKDLKGTSPLHVDLIRRQYDDLQIEEAKSACGTYGIHWSGGAWVLWSPVEQGEDLLGEFPTAEDAKAAAQADFEAHIRSALVEDA